MIQWEQQTNKTFINKIKILDPTKIYQFKLFHEFHKTRSSNYFTNLTRAAPIL